MQSEDKNKDKCDLTGMLSVQLPELVKWEIKYHVNHAQNYFTIDIPDVSIYGRRFWYEREPHVRIIDDKGEEINSIELDDETIQRLGIALEEKEFKLRITSNNEDDPFFGKSMDNRVSQKMVGWIDKSSLFTKLYLTNEEIRNILFITQGGLKNINFHLHLKRACLTDPNVHGLIILARITALDFSRFVQAGLFF